MSIDPANAPRHILSRGELKGLALFNGKAGCAACHVTADFEPGVIPPLLTDYTYDNLGIPTNPRVYELAVGAPPDLGLGARLGEADQNGKFKVPTLRNVTKSAPYGHNGYFPTLSMIVNFYNLRDVPGSTWYELPPEVPENVNRTEMGDLGLTAREEMYIISFLHTLTDRYPIDGRGRTRDRGHPSGTINAGTPPPIIRCLACRSVKNMGSIYRAV